MTGRHPPFAGLWAGAARCLARHRTATSTALLVATVVAAAAVGSLVRLLVFGTSPLGFDRPAVAAVSVVCAILATPTVVGIVLVLLRGEDDGGGTRRDDKPPTPDGPSDAPDWWPEFEHDFAAYVAECEHGGAKTAALGGGANTAAVANG